MSKHRKAVYVGRETRTEPSACLGCGKILDAARGIGNRNKPKPGMFSVCLACGHLQAFGWDLKLRALTDAEMTAVAGDERIIAIQKARALAFAIGLKPKP
jgi:hypothetical protein